MNITEVMSCLDSVIYECTTSGSVFPPDVAGIVANLGGDPNVIYNNSDVTVWMTYMNTLAIRYLLQENLK